MTPSREPSPPKISGLVWIAVAAILAAVPIALSIGVPAPPPDGRRAPALRQAPAPPSALTGSGTAEPSAAATAPSGAGDPDLGVTTPRTRHDVEYDALETEMAALKIEKGAIEAEEARLRGKREELEGFERDHPDGVPPELYSRYEDARATYNSDVQAFKSRASAYRMKADEIERRLEALGSSAP